LCSSSTGLTFEAVSACCGTRPRRRGSAGAVAVFNSLPRLGGWVRPAIAPGTGPHGKHMPSMAVLVRHRLRLEDLHGVAISYNLGIEGRFIHSAAEAHPCVGDLYPPSLDREEEIGWMFSRGRIAHGTIAATTMTTRTKADTTAAGPPTDCSQVQESPLGCWLID
jgi:hypothetical protein